MNATDSSNLVDSHVGARIEMRRVALGLTREALAQVMNVTVQQVEAFEAGRDRVWASALFDLADLFDVKVAYFFQVDAFEGRRGPSTSGGFHEVDEAG